MAALCHWIFVPRFKCCDTRVLATKRAGPWPPDLRDRHDAPIWLGPSGFLHIRGNTAYCVCLLPQRGRCELTGGNGLGRNLFYWPTHSRTPHAFTVRGVRCGRLPFRIIFYVTFPEAPRQLGTQEKIKPAYLAQTHCLRHAVDFTIDHCARIRGRARVESEIC